jgi:hypothetical protein
MNSVSERTNTIRQEEREEERELDEKMHVSVTY